METKNERKEINIKSCTCYYFYDIIPDRDIYFVHFLLDNKLYEAYKNILVCDI